MTVLVMGSVSMPAMMSIPQPQFVSTEQLSNLEKCLRQAGIQVLNTVRFHDAMPS
eukprot:CAMPEP_0115505522 /NCGR_PEP_ID=MMETSP0271-20121206/70625_2 /TAXON_ID=71861 /ORGANISM="Scrippsiella trochoidea, Strain CCMP3099" /LENGTH=54 /DNA_ID=CAMNT_0002934827 /DNA_START=72 /DNA_END=236 /DNA_ORIENTATION=-